MSLKIDTSLSRILELDAILENVMALTVSPLGKEYFQDLSLFKSPPELEKPLAQTTEMRDLLRFDDPFPLYAFDDLRLFLHQADIVGSFLQPEAFIKIRFFLSIIHQIHEYLKDKEDRYPLLQEERKYLQPLPDLIKIIDKRIDNSGQIKDSASDTLRSLRRAILNKSSRIRSRLESILRRMVSDDHAQENMLALRDGRLVIPMKEGQRSKLKGVIVDQSASGATVFMEPLDVLEMNNDLRRLHIQERREIEKILMELTRLVRENKDSISNNLSGAGFFDFISAKARFSIQVEGNPAAISIDQNLHLVEARHPLLLLRDDKKNVIPLSLSMERDLKTLIITGPNAGGKTVAIKTIGLLALMHQLGLHVPAKEGTSLPLFSNVFADIGDQQSIEKDLSTFSSHMMNLKKIIGNADNNSLILLDEIGSATDPAEGSVLAEVILKYLTKKECLTVATTHMGSLKLFAHEEAGIENGSMVFDQNTLQPTYQFQMGIPGSSYAFEIAERFGISKKLIQEAKERVGHEHGKLDKMIQKLEEDLRKTNTLRQEADIKDSELSGLIKLYNQRYKELQKESSEKKQQILLEAEAILKESNKLIENTVREIRQEQASKASIQKVRQEIQKQKERIQALSQKPIEENPPFKDITKKDVAKGDWVSWPGHSGIGQVLTQPDKKGKVQVQWDHVKLRVPAADLNCQSPPKKKSTFTVSDFRRKDVQAEVDLRGLTAEEAIETVERYLGEARATGYSSICIIHGKGTGVLRKTIGSYLKRHSQVRSSRLGSWNEGDTGVTIVELK